MERVGTKPTNAIHEVEVEVEVDLAICVRYCSLAWSLLNVHLSPFGMESKERSWGYYRRDPDHQKHSVVSLQTIKTMKTMKTSQKLSIDTIGCNECPYLTS